MEVHSYSWSSVLDYLESSLAICIETGETKQVIRVQPEFRKQILAGVRWHELQNICKRKVFTIKYELSHGKENATDLTSHKEVFRPFFWPESTINIVSGVATIPDEYSETIYLIEQAPAEAKNSCLKLPSFEETKKGAVFVIRNQTKSYIQCFAKERSKKLPQASEWLGAGEVLFMRRGEKNWEYLGKGVRNLPGQVAANPLLRESGPAVECKQEVINYENDGEYYLTRPVIEDRLKKKLAKKGDNFRYHYCASNNDLKTAIKTAENSPCYFIYENRDNNHMTAGWVQVSDDVVQCYLHETVGAESHYTEPLVKKVRANIEAAFPGKRVGILLPKERLQEDYVSCGVMAIKAMFFLASHPGWLAQLFRQEKVSGENLFDPVQVQALPAGIVKLCQNYTLICSHPRQQDKVNSKQTLEQYLKRYTCVIEGRRLPFNAAAYLKRYKYLMGYIKDHAESPVAAVANESLPKRGKISKRRTATTSMGPLAKIQRLDKVEIGQQSTVSLKAQYKSSALLQEYNYCVPHRVLQSQVSRDSSGYGSS